MPSDTDQRGGIQVLHRTADILRALQGHPAGLSQAEIGERVGLPRSTVSRLLQSLEGLGWVSSMGARGPYRLGPEIIALSASARRGVLTSLRPFLEALSRTVNETVDLSVLDGDRAVFLDQVVSDHRLRTVSAVGDSFPLHACANGKAMLASLTPSDLDQVLAGPLPRLTAHTCTSARALRRELATTSRTGVAFDREEHSEGVCAVGAVLPPLYGDVLAVSIPVPVSRFRGREDELTDALRHCVAGVADWAAASV